MESTIQLSGIPHFGKPPHQLWKLSLSIIICDHMIFFLSSTLKIDVIFLSTLKIYVSPMFVLPTVPARFPVRLAVAQAKGLLRALRFQALGLRQTWRNPLGEQPVDNTWSSTRKNGDVNRNKNGEFQLQMWRFRELHSNSGTYKFWSNWCKQD